jgi:competence protein ComEC
MEIPRAPLLWVLVPQLSGCLTGLMSPVSPIWCWLLGGGALVVALLARVLSSPSGKTAGIVAAYFLSWGWMETKESDALPMDVLGLPPRAVALELEIKRIYRQTDKFERVSGVGRVATAPLEMEYLLGQDVYILAYRKGLEDPLVRGEKVTIKGIVYPLGWRDGELDGFGTYLQKQGVFFEIRRALIEKVGSDTPPFQKFCCQANLRAQEILRTGPGGDSVQADARVAMMLGDKEALGYDLKEAFKRSGTMHLFAVSGLHVGMIAISLAFLLRFLPIPHWGQTIFGIIVLWLYVQVTGGQPSAIRAFIMAAIFWGGSLVMRKGMPFAALVASAVLVLAINPLDLTQLGFQLSYAVVWVIILYGIPLGEAIQAKLTSELKFIPAESMTVGQKLRVKLKEHMSGVFGICFAAMLASTPLMVGHFGLLVVGGILLNMLTAFVASVAIVLGAAALFFGILHVGPVVVLLNVVSGQLVSLMILLVNAAVSMPGYYYETGFRHEAVAPGIVVLLLAGLVLLQKFRPKLGAHFFWIPPAACAIVTDLAIVPAQQ